MDTANTEKVLGLIREAQASGATKVSLRGLSIERLPEDIGELTQIQKLDLSWCTALTDVHGLAGLTGLQTLDLSGCSALTDVQVLAGLTGLQMLNLSGCDVLKDVQVLAGLTRLRTLDLSACFALTDVQGLAGLTRLQTLDLNDCMALTDVQVLAGLRGLQTLNLSGCDAFRDVQVLAGLTGLQMLHLDRCSALTDVQMLAGLTGLQTLYLRGCSALTDVGVLAGLTGLQELDLSRCSALTDVQVLAGLTGLQELHLSGCSALTDVQVLAGLTGLQRLDLRGYLLECAPDRYPLPLSGALVQVFADRLRSAPAELGSREYDDNALPRIRAWQQDLEAGEAASSTLKLFILGNGAVGKTQICRRLRGEAFDPSVPSTHGIQQFQVRLFDGDEEMAAVDAHVWDFGGQDVYLGTHELFVDAHAIFVLCWNSEYENTQEFTQHGTVMRNRPLPYWLAYVESLAAQDTPVIVVQTQCDRARNAQHAAAIGTHGLRWVKPVACSAKRNDGIKELLAALESAARGQLEVQGKVRLPQSWVDLGASLGSSGERLMPRGQFDALCGEHGVRAPPAVVLEYLHRSGRVFWREGLFNDHIVLDQSWALKGVYAVLERETLMPMIRQQRGRFSLQLLALTAWRDNTDAEREHFLRLMEQCRICFKVDDGAYVAPAYTRALRLPIPFERFRPVLVREESPRRLTAPQVQGESACLRLCVAMQACRRHFSTPPPRIKRVMGPFDL